MMTCRGAGFLLLCAISGIRSDGVPLDACMSASPAHAVGSPQSNSAAPYKVEASLQTDGTTKALVTIGSPTNTPFVGFSLQARAPGSSVPAGTWTTVGSAIPSRTVDCQGSVGAVLTSADEGQKRQVSATWTPPPDFEGEVDFFATIVQSFETFWVGIQSKPVVIQKMPLLLRRPASSAQAPSQTPGQDTRSESLPPPTSGVGTNRNGLEAVDGGKTNPLIADASLPSNGSSTAQGKNSPAKIGNAKAREHVSEGSQSTPSFLHVVTLSLVYMLAST